LPARESQGGVSQKEAYLDQERAHSRFSLKTVSPETPEAKIRENGLDPARSGTKKNAFLGE